ncbi:MAG TPA: FtsX-like permease family protein, partial [Gemmatimonadales bacterium]|nr:FtsX-like permease family protein [Gemmatimonadales bacterium]
RIPPLAALRRPYEAESPAAPRDRWRWGAGAALGASVAGLAVLQAGHWRTGLLFAGAVGIALLLLWLAALGLIRAARRWSPARGSYLWRQGLANLHRPANQTVVVVLALGFGAFLLATLLVVQQNLLREIRLTGGPRRPNLVVFDVQTDQARAVTEVLRRAGVEPSPAVPIVPMRIASVNGAPTSRLLVQGTDGHAGDDDGPSGWALRREYRSTYRDTTVASERLVAGTWWRGDAPATGAVPISLEAGIAAELGVAPGDTITWDVQGVRIASVVANLREVDWARFEPNFFVVFPPGPLDRAPQTLVLLARVEDVAARARLQRQVVEAAPNVSVLDLTQIQESLERLLGKVVLAIRFMALFSLLAGLVVLAGAIAANRFQRVREAVLLKTLGATRRQIAVIVLAEHLALGGLAAIVALGLAGLAGWGLMRFVFETDFALPLGPLLGLGLGVAALTASVGLWNGSEAVRQTPLEALREQG